MYTSILVLASIVASVAAIPQAAASSASSAPISAQPSAANMTVSLGAACTPSSTVCANGAQCYAVNSMLIPLCGNFQSSCTSNTQCAFNTCVSGFCSGPPSLSAASPTTYMPGSTSIATQQSPTSSTASLPLGAVCKPSSTPCANGSQCYAVNSMIIPRCGNFQAECTSDSQCAFNTCVNGFCSGILLTSSTGTGGLSPTSSSGGRYTNYTLTVTPTPGFTTSVIVVTGQTSSVLVNGAGATTSFGSAASPTAVQASGAEKAVGGVGALFIVAVGAAVFL